MWVLECDGDPFSHKRLWLIPGSTHILGRTRSHGDLDENGSAFHGINNKSVSRKHATISVSPVMENLSLRMNEKSALKIEDLSKMGTILDGVRLEPKNAVILGNDEHEIKLGNWEHTLKIKWVQVSLALTYLSKKNIDSGVLQVRQKLESADIKISTEFEGGYTTHVVATKRNAPPVLEGLVAGCFIVTDEYIDALVQACTPKLDSEKAPLEIDFDLNWPDPMLHVPPISKEPIARSSDYLAPKTERANLFSNFTFIFCSRTQMESLGKPINRGGGKAIVYEEYEEGASSPQDFATFIRKIAGQQGSSDLTSAISAGSVIVVRIQVMEPNSEWKTNFIQGTDLILGKRSVAQNEFLDVILTCDTSSLQSGLEEVQIPSSAPTVSSSNKIDSGKSALSVRDLSPHKPIDMKQEVSSPVKSVAAKRLRYGRAVSRFRGFDDFKAESFPSVPSVDEDQNDDEKMLDVAAESTTYDDHTTEDLRRLEISSPSQAENRGKKRTQAESAIDNLLPAAATMKRRRIESGKDKVISSVEENSQIHQEARHPRKRIFRKTAIPKEIDGDDELEAASRRAEQRTTEEERTEPLAAEEVLAIRNGVKIEEIAVRELKKHSGQREDDGWDPRWNGRKNFKKFKRRGEGPQPMRGHRVTIRLEESRNKNPLLGSIRHGGTSVDITTSVGSKDGNTYNSEGNDDSQFVRRGYRSNKNDTVSLRTLADLSDGEFSDHETGDITMDLEVLPAKYRQKVDGISQSQNLEQSGESVIRRTQLSGTVTKKRSATGKPASGQSPPLKKITSSSNTIRSSRFGNDDAGSGGSEDELRFRGRRKRG